MADEKPQPMRLFYSYSHKDAALRDELETHLAALKRSGIIQGWSDRDITGGQEWAGQIDQNLEAADIILLLVSADFLASDYCYDKEMARALERQAAGAARVIPIVMRPVDWESTPFHKLQALPAGAKAITTWPNRDEGWVDVAKGIRRVVQALADERTAAKPPPAPAPDAPPVTPSAAPAGSSGEEWATDVTRVPSYKDTRPLEDKATHYKILTYKGHRIDVLLHSWTSRQKIFYDLKEASDKRPTSVVSPSAGPHVFTVSEDGQMAQYEIALWAVWDWHMTVKRNGAVIWEGKL